MSNHQMEQSKPLLIDGERRSSQDSLDDYFVSQPTAKRMLFKAASSVHPAHITTILKRLGYSLIPQPLRLHFWDDHGPTTKQFPTSYLSGLRGLTAFKVFTFHYMMAYTDFTYFPWGMDEKHTQFMALPFVRYTYAGFTSHIFFGVAGYLTSLRLFQLIDRNDSSSQAKILSSVAGSIFRRGFRLYLPVFIMTFITATYIYLGLYERNRPIIADHERYFPGEWNENKPNRYSSYIEQLGFWAHEMYDLSNINTEATIYPMHDQHLWSILAEMRASLHLYGCLIALMQCKRHIRLALLVALAFIYFCWNRWEVWVYILGAAIAQLDIILTDRQDKQQPLLSEKERVYTPHILQIRVSDNMAQAIRYTGFIVAFYLLSFPIYADRFYSPGYETLKLLIPGWVDRKDKYYANIGTILLLFLLVRSDAKTSKWRRLLMSPIPQYLGSISFALYLTQGLLLHMYGYMIPQWVWWTLKTEQRDVHGLAWIIPILIGWIVSAVTVIWIADVWTREVEGRCIRFVKWVERVCFKEK